MKTVGVIGLGPAGLATVKELKEAGLQVTAFDRARRVGGRWACDDSVESGIWQELCMNSTRRTMEFSDFQWEGNNDGYAGRDKAYGVFPHCTEAGSYLEVYAKHFDLYPSCQLETEVSSVTEAENGEGWKIVTKSVKSGDTTTHTFDALVVCSGGHCKPVNPLKQTFQNFTGNFLHAQNFRSAKGYKGNVLVIGSSISGSEIANSIASEGECNKVYNSVRHVPYHITKFSEKSMQSFDEILYIRFPVWLGRFLPPSVTSKGLKTTVLGDWPTQLTKKNAWTDPDPDIRNANLTLTNNYLECVEKGSIEVKPSVASVEGRKVTFDDGTSVECDTVIAATGYEVDVSFLPDRIREKVEYTAPFSGKQSIALYKHTLVPGFDNLAFAGIMENIGSQWGAAEMQARYIAATFSGTLSRPSDDKLKAGVDEFKKFKEEHPFNAFDVATKIQEDIGDELGVTPSYLEGIWNAKRLLFAPLFNVYYRTNPKVEGEEKAKKFQAVFDRYLSSPQTAAWNA